MWHLSSGQVWGGWQPQEHSPVEQRRSRAGWWCTMLCTPFSQALRTDASSHAALPRGPSRPNSLPSSSSCWGQGRTQRKTMSKGAALSQAGVSALWWNLLPLELSRKWAIFGISRLNATYGQTGVFKTKIALFPGARGQLKYISSMRLLYTHLFPKRSLMGFVL